MPKQKKKAVPCNGANSKKKCQKTLETGVVAGERNNLSTEDKLRPNLFDNLGAEPDTNLFCKIQDLSNEASVETFFVNRLLESLGYEDRNIKPKISIDELAVPKGRSKINYKPDYVLMAKGRPRVVIDAKATEENLDGWVEQCSGYSLLLNQQFSDDNPVKYFVLTNGVLTRIYAWDVATPILEVGFTDFNIGNPKYEQFRALLEPSAVAQSTSPRESTFVLKRPSPEEAKRIFAQCHKIIWKSEGYSPTAAFMEFVKLMFVKLWADRALRNDPSVNKLLQVDGSVSLPRSAITFAVHWINESPSDDPINDVLFKQLRDRIEKDIAFRKKKRIFEKDERINMRPDTIKAVVKRLEHYDMFGIDEDLNGRLFETFLSATMRGRELGQYFTPRSIVKLMTRMANLEATPSHVDKTIDACCGTGGFLIEVLSDMRNKVRENGSLVRAQKEKLLDVIANESIFGIDFGQSPPIAKIARINMYLHGDGGTRIYYADSLDKDIEPFSNQDPEVLANQDELKKLIDNGFQFDVALTNPPFSMTKELSNDTEARILKRYALAKDDGTNRYRPSLRSSSMFIERYSELVRPGGRFFTVIDDTLLSSDNYSYVRDFIRREFIIRGIVSLPGDAFRRSGARVKTSILCLEKRSSPGNDQPLVFYSFAENIGVDDLPSKASDFETIEARKQAEDEIERIANAYSLYLKGKPVDTTITPDRVADRLDLKYVVPLSGRFVSEWISKGIEVKYLGDVVTEVNSEFDPHKEPDKEYKLINITYDGACQEYKTQLGRHIAPKTMFEVRKGDLVFSNVRATDGAIGIVPEELDGAIVSGSYVVLRCSDAIDTAYLWFILRTAEIKADLMSSSTGTSRYTTDWQTARFLKIPWVDRERREVIASSVMKTWALEREIRLLSKCLVDGVLDLGVESESSKKRLSAYQPPK